MSDTKSFIEVQFPVSKISKESYKERKSSQGQTITGLGKWWGRKPLILVRSAIIGTLMPASDNPSKDTDIFLKILSMDKRGLEMRKEKRISNSELAAIIMSNPRLKSRYASWINQEGDKIQIDKEAPREEMEIDAFNCLGYDEKIALCMRPEQLENLDDTVWDEINDYLDTRAHNLDELIEQLSEKKYGRNVVVGDAFCGGGSIPFEASRIGCNVYASDLNPIAATLTWADLNICGASNQEYEKLLSFMTETYKSVEDEVTKLGIEENDEGDRALSYLYCNEVICPECRWSVPVLPSFVIGARAGKVIAKINECDNRIKIEILSNVSDSDFKKAKDSGTIKNNLLICPHCGKTTPISSIRKDRVNENGDTVSGLRQWGPKDYKPREDDVYHERLYAVRYEKRDGSRYYTEPSERDYRNEKIIADIVESEFDKWQDEGLIPAVKIESGYNTDQIIRERGWNYWHQLYNERQLFILSRFASRIRKAKSPIEIVGGILGLNKCVDFCSKLCRWDPSTDKIAQTFYNQAFNTLMNYGTRSLRMLSDPWNYSINRYKRTKETTVELRDARSITQECDLWITDPPYADAVNYHELSEYFLAWDKKHLNQAFSSWYSDSKRVLAVRGDDKFSNTMIEIYSNLCTHMSEDGKQIVMFTHSNPSVWAQLAIIMWKSGLRVTAAWNIATETEAVGLKNGNYVKGTVILVLKKQDSSDIAFLDEINADIRNEVKKQIENMQMLDDKEEPNFSDPDYVLAAYAASLKVLTAYAEIEDLDLDYELNQAIKNPTGSKIVAIIENAKKIAYDCVIPTEIDSYMWRDLTNAEKFFIKGLESEKRGDYSISTYQEFARGFSIGGYSQLMANEKANSARLKTPFEMASRSMNDVPDFESSLTRIIFTGIYVGIKEDMNPSRGLDFIKNELPNYWDKREMIQQILSFLVNIKDISNMQPHWTSSAELAEQLLTLVSHDSI